MLSFDKVKIVVVGDFMWSWYQDVAADNLMSHGCTVIKFGWFNDFWYKSDNSIEPIFKSIFHKLQYRYQFGPLLFLIQNRLIETIDREKPNVLFCYNVTIFSSSFIKSIKQKFPKLILCQYANDNPFSLTAKKMYWRNFTDSIKYFDLHYVFRTSNISDFKQRGAKSVKLLRAYFIPEKEFEINQNFIPNKFKCDVVFAGHFENDGRLKYLEDICNAGFKLNLFGGGWDNALKILDPDSPLRSKYPIKPVVGKEYQYAICGAKVALCFLSTLNNDTYTTRSFQIPAMKTAMLSQYTEDLATIYSPDIDVAFFNSREEFMQKLKNLINNKDYRNSLAINSFEKVYRSGHDIKNRMFELLIDIQKHYPNFTK